ncbi:MAG: tetratricopeptide repeat protein [Tissierellia bacterium]|nr:tetratricopeptide repeat protein [Tissierellia bacterium]
MSLVDKYFREKTSKLSYLELKNFEEKYLDYGLNDIPLPIVTDDLMMGLQNDNFQNEVGIEYIVEGMLFNIALDNDFRYANDYRNVLKNILDDPSKYAVNLGMKKLDASIEDAIILFRAAYVLDEKNNYAAYNYGRLLWRLDVDENDRGEFVYTSIKILEKTIIEDSQFALGYYELANIYKATGEYLKAMNYYKKTLAMVKIESLQDEIRTLMVEIEPEALVEDAIYFINKMNYNKALEILSEASKKASRFDVLYYMAVCYMNLERLDLAQEYFEKALDGGADFATLYIDYIYVLYAQGRPEMALDVANEAIDKYPADIKLRYNRALIFAELGLNTKAVEDLDFILEYQDLSDEMFNQVMIIKESLIS